MKTQMIAGAAVSIFAASAMAGGTILTHTFDISGAEVDGGFGANFFTDSHDFGAEGTVVEVSVDVNFETVPRAGRARPRSPSTPMTTPPSTPT